MKQQKHKDDSHMTHEHNHSHNNITKWFWIKSITIGLIYLCFVVINIIEPTNNSKYLWHYGIWLPLTSYIVFWEGRHYLKIYANIFKGILDMDTLIGLAAHILYVFSLGMVIAHFNSPMFSYPQMWEGTAVLIVITNIGHALYLQVHENSFG